MDFKITYAKTEDELIQIADMMGKVFVSKNYFDFYKLRMTYQKKDPYYKPEFSRIIKVGEKIVSHVSVVEKHMRIGHAVVKIGGIADVFTHPDYRNQNFTRILMEDALKYMEKSKFPISMLYGIMNFYHKFGYIESILNPVLNVPIKNLSSIYSEGIVRPFKESDIPFLNKLYNMAFKGKNFSVERIEKLWFKIPAPDTGFIVPNAKDEPIAYVFTSAPPKPKSQTFYIKEVVAFDQNSAAAIVAFLREQAQALFINELEIHQRPDTYFIKYLMDFGGNFTTKIPYEGMGQGMLRILLIKELFEDIKDELSRRVLLRCDAPKKDQITFKTDIGEVTLEKNEEGIKIAKKSGKKAEIIETPQNALIRLISGYYDVDCFLNRIKAPKIPDKTYQLLNILFPKDFPYTCESDYF